MVREDFPEEVTSEIINPRKLNLQKRKVKFEGQTLSSLCTHKKVWVPTEWEKILAKHII